MAGGSGKVTILQSLADHDPDVDAIYRLTAKMPLAFENKKQAGPRSANTLGKVDVVPAGVMSPFNAQAVVFARPAFWGMLMPVTVRQAKTLAISSSHDRQCFVLSYFRGRYES